MLEPRGDETEEEEDIRLGISCERENKIEKVITQFDDIPVHIRERVYSDIGEASVSWENPEGAGIFETEHAARISLELCQFILDEIEKAKKSKRRDERTKKR